MRILVTGGTGFLGVNLVRLLVSCEQQVRLLVRANSNRLGLNSDLLRRANLIEFVPGDVTDAASVREAMRGCDQVYHLAAWVQICPWGMKLARQVNVEGTRNVCAAALELGVHRMVHTSSIATMAAGTLEEPADEDTEWNLAELHIPYYWTKREAEGVVLKYIDRGLDAVIVNPTYLVGPWDVKPSAGRMLIHAATSRLRFSPSRGGINYVDVRRAAAGHRLAMENGTPGERYILGGENLSFASFLRKVTTVVGVPVPRLALPYAVMYPAAAAGSVAGRFFPRFFRDANLSVLRSAFLEHFVSSEKARLALGFNVTSVDEAIEDAITWFREHGYMTFNPVPEPSRQWGSRRRGPNKGPGRHIETARIPSPANR